METLRRIDEDIQTLSAEAKKKYPEVTGAADRAAETLKAMREQYVAEVMRKAGGSAGNNPTKFRSAMLTAPYILACNHANASVKLVMMALNGIQLLLDSDAFELDDAQNVFRVLAIQCGVGKSETQLKILQLILQILGNIINDQTETKTILNEALIGNIMTIVLSLGDKKNHGSVVNTVYISVRQIMSLLFGKFRLDIKRHVAATLGGGGGPETVSLMPPSVACRALLSKYESSLKTSLELLLKEFTFYLKGDVGHWLRGIEPIPIVSALDIVYDIINDWQDILTAVPAFATILKDHICVTLRNLLKNMQEDYVVALKFHISTAGASPNVPNTANIYATKLVKIVRCIMLKYAITPDLVGEIETMVTLLLHTLHPDKTKIVDATQVPSGSSTGKTLAHSFIGFLTGGNMEELQTKESVTSMKENSSMGIIMTKVAADPKERESIPLGGNGGSVASASSTSSLSLSNTANISNSSKDSRGKSGKELDPQQYHSCGSIYLLLSNKSGNPSNPVNVVVQGTGASSGAQPSEQPCSTDHIPAHPAAICLEALLAFYLREHVVEDLVRNDQNIAAMVSLAEEEKEEKATPAGVVSGGAGVSTITVCISTTLLSICTLLTSALTIHTNAVEFETFTTNCSVTALVERIISGAVTSKEDVEGVVQQIHEHLTSMHTVGSMYVLSLCFSILRLLTRNMSKFVLQTSGVDVSSEAGSVSRAEAEGAVVSTPTSTPVTTNSKHAQCSNGVIPFKKCGAAYSLFISPSFCGVRSGTGAQSALTAVREEKIGLVMRTCLLAISELCHEAILDMCHGLISVMLETTGSNVSGGSNFSTTSISMVQTIGVLSEWGLIFGVLGCPRYCENVMSALCKYSLPKPSGGDTTSELNAVLRQKHVQSFLQLNKIIHVVAESISDWDLIIDCFELIMSFVISNSTANKSISASGGTHNSATTGSSSVSNSGTSAASGSGSGGLGTGSSSHSSVSAVGFMYCAADVSVNDVVQMLGVLERFKQYACFLSDDTLVHLMTSLVSLSINSISSYIPAGPAATGGSTAYAESSSTSYSSSSSSSSSGGASSATSRRMSALTSAMGVGSAVGSGGGGSSNAAGGHGHRHTGGSTGAVATSRSQHVIDISSILTTCLKNGTMTVPAYMNNGFLSGVIKFSFYAAVEIAKMNAPRISCVWQMLTTHLKMLASTKTGLLRSAAVHATLDVILTTLNVTTSSSLDEEQSSKKPAKALTALEQNAMIMSALGIDRIKFLPDADTRDWIALAAGLGTDGTNSRSSYAVFSRILVLPDSVYCSDIMPLADTIFAPRVQHQQLLLQRQMLPVNGVVESGNSIQTRSRHSSASIQLTQTDILASLKMLSQIVHNDVRNEVIQGIYQLLQSYDSNNYDSASDAYSIPCSSSPSGQDSGASKLSYSGWLAILEIITSIPLSWTSIDKATRSSTSSASTPVSTPIKKQMSSDDHSRNMNDLSYATIATPARSSANTTADSVFVSDVPEYPSPPASPMPVAEAEALSRSSSTSPAPAPQWSSIALNTAFNCMKLICDELLEDISIEIIVRVISCLASFSLQTHDVNISLTSIELMWKVTDSMVSKYTLANNKQTSEGTVHVGDSSSVYHAEIILNVMMAELFQLCTDSRPEIRNCAIKTLFSAMLSYMTHPILSNKWQSIFNDNLFPLFIQIHKGTLAAMHNNAEAFAPEVKKGVKITVHHSRNTSLKQWSETYVIALKALGRIMKSCVKPLLSANWFAQVWRNAIEVCMNAVYVTVAAGPDAPVEMFSLDNEVTVASVEVLFVLLRCTAGPCVSSSRGDKAAASISNSSKKEAIPPSLTPEEKENAKKMSVLWRTTWRHTKTAALGLIRGKSMYHSSQQQGATSSSVGSRPGIGGGSHGASAVETIHKFITGLYEFYLDYYATKFKDIDGTDGDSSSSACENTVNFRDLLQILMFVTRQLILITESSLDSVGAVNNNGSESVLEDEATSIRSNHSSPAPVPAVLQYNRVILQLLMSLHPTSKLQLKMLFYALSDICYGRNYVRYTTNSMAFAAGGLSGSDDDDGAAAPATVLSTYYFGAVEPKLRVDIGSYVLSVLNILIANSVSTTPNLSMNSPTAASLRKASSSSAEPNKPFLFFSQSVSASAATSMKSGATASVIKLLDAEKAQGQTTSCCDSAHSVLLECCNIVCNRFVYNICDIAVSIRKELVLAHAAASTSFVASSKEPSRLTTVVPTHKGTSANFVPVSVPALTIGENLPSPSQPQLSAPVTASSPIASFGTLISSIGKLILPDAENESPHTVDTAGTDSSRSAGLLAPGVFDSDSDADASLLFPGVNRNSSGHNQVEWRRFLVQMQTQAPTAVHDKTKCNNPEWRSFPISELELHLVGKCIEMKMNYLESTVQATTQASEKLMCHYSDNSFGESEGAGSTEGRGSPRARSVDGATIDLSYVKSNASNRGGNVDATVHSMKNTFFILHCLLTPWTMMEFMHLRSNSIPRLVNMKSTTADSDSVLRLQNSQIVSALRDSDAVADSAAPLDDQVIVKTISQLTVSISAVIVRIAASSQGGSKAISSSRSRSTSSISTGRADSSMSPEQSRARPLLTQGLGPFCRELTTLVDILLASGLVIIHALKMARSNEVSARSSSATESDTEVAESENGGPTLLVNNCYMNAILTCLCDMLTDAADCQDQLCAGDYRRHALFTLLTLTSELSHSVISHTVVFTGANNKVLEASCMSYLSAIKDLQVELSCLPTELATHALCPEVNTAAAVDADVNTNANVVTTALLSGWCTLMLNDARPARMLAPEDLGLLAYSQQQCPPLCSLFNKLRYRKEAGASSLNIGAIHASNTPLGMKGHIWLLLSLVYQLIAFADSPAIKSIAIELSQSFQMQDIVTNYVQLLYQNASLGSISAYGSPTKNTRKINL